MTPAEVRELKLAARARSVCAKLRQLRLETKARYALRPTGLTIYAAFADATKRPMHVRARREVYALLRAGGMSYPEIGALVGLDHTTIIGQLRARDEERKSRRKVNEASVEAAEAKIREVVSATPDELHRARLAVGSLLDRLQRLEERVSALEGRAR